MSIFEVGHRYSPWDSGIDPITILKRTDKTIWVSNSVTSWKMRVKTDHNGDEYATDSSVPQRWRQSYTYNAFREVTE